MKSAFDQIINRIGTASIKWDGREEEFGNAELIPFSIADSDFHMMPEIAEAMEARIRRDALGYTDTDDAYFNAVTSWCKARHSYDVKKEWITSTAGILPAISAAIASLLCEGDGVIIQTPVYDPFESVIEANNCRTVYCPLLIKDKMRYEMDFDDLEHSMRDGAKMMILCNPHNPVGRVWSSSELSKLIELCRQYDVILVSDEIHWDLIMPGYEHTTVGTLVNDEDKLILCTAPSKTFNIAGLQASNIIIRNTEIRTAFQGWLFSRYMFGANLLGLTACMAAYEHGSAWVDEQNKYIAENARLVSDYFKTHLPKASVAPLEGTFLMWIDMSYLGLSSDKLVKIIAEHGAGLNSGQHYGKQCDGFVRMNIACPRDLLVKGLESISRAVMSVEE